jgi:hypothetical protein
MYLFARTFIAKPGRAAAVAAWSINNLQRSSTVAGVPLNLVTSVGAGPVGSFGITTVFPDLTALDEAGGRLAADVDGIKALEEFGPLLVAPPEDSLFEIVAGGPSPDGPPAYAVMARGKATLSGLTDAVAASTKLAKLMTKHGARSTSVCVSVVGQYGEIAIIGGYETIADYEASRRAGFADEGFAKISERLDDSSIPGTQSVTLVRQLKFVKP